MYSLLQVDHSTEFPYACSSRSMHCTLYATVCRFIIYTTSIHLQGVDVERPSVTPQPCPWLCLSLWLYPCTSVDKNQGSYSRYYGVFVLCMGFVMMKHMWASLAVNWRSKEDVDTGCCEVCYLRVLQIA